MIVVTGATGNVGRELVRILAGTGTEVTAVARRVADVPAGVRAVSADLADAATLDPALEGADAVFLCPAGDLLVSAGSPLDLIATIEKAGVRRVVLLSSQAAGTRPDAVSHARIREFEDVLRDTTLDWTILRPGGFATNTFAHLESIKTSRAVFAPFGDVALPLIDPADIAAVAAAVLREDGHSGATYVLNGPDAISPREQTAALAAAIGTDLAFHEVTRTEAHAAMLRFMPEPVAEGTLDILGTPTPDERTPTGHVDRILGRPATPYTTWASRMAPAFA